MKYKIAILIILASLPFLSTFSSCHKEKPERGVTSPPEGALPGLFTVDRTGNQVWLSRGNLQYQASSGQWRFAPHQYSYLGDANTTIGDTLGGWIDLFGWGTGLNPCDTSTQMDYYQFHDWGSNLEGNWRTLTIGEWKYILSERPGADSLCSTGSVDSLHGLILLPDKWVLPSGCTFRKGFGNAPNDWQHNHYSFSQWSQMEANGAVFLPAAGHRWGRNVGRVGVYGNYWSSSSYYVNSSFHLGFYANGAAEGYNYRFYGQSVRLAVDRRRE